MAEVSQEKIVEAMCSPDFYPHRPVTVELIKTHISLVFLAGEFVYKVKKPVSLGFLDFSTLEKRKFYCEEELRLNRRLAPDFYLAVVPIHEGSAGRPTLAAEGRVVEYAVLMKKLPEERMVKTLLATGRAPDALFDELGRKIAAFHAGAAGGEQISRMGLPETVAANHEENFAQMASYVDVTIPVDQYRFIKAYDESFIARRRSLLERRVAQGRIRECHGDLHLAHICATDGIVVFDCIEFNERFRCSDTAAEVAFLSMDMDFNGYHAKGERFVDAYLRHSGDAELPRLLDFYRCYYAFVRGKVASLRLAQREEAFTTSLDIMEESEKYFNLAWRYAARLERPALILVLGLTGTGKTYLSQRLARIIGAEVIRTDVLRKELVGLAPTERRLDEFGSGIYGDDMTRRTYAEALARAGHLIQNGRAVIIDASFKRRALRQEAAALAARLGVESFVIECTCPEETIRRRLARRMGEGSDASDGRWEIYLRQRGDFDPVDEVSPGRYLRLDGALDFKGLLDEAVTKISSAAWSGGESRD